MENNFSAGVNKLYMFVIDLDIFTTSFICEHVSFTRYNAMK